MVKHLSEGRPGAYGAAAAILLLALASLSDGPHHVTGGVPIRAARPIGRTVFAVRPATAHAQEAAPVSHPSDWSIPERYRGKLVSRRVRYFPEKILALTFDDGPDSEVTPTILKTLAEHGAHATFFVLGQHARRHPELLTQMLEAGHAIGNHTYSHPARPPASRAADELDRTQRIIREITDRDTALFRPPYGITTSSTARLALRRDRTVILWTVSSADTTRIGPEAIAKNVIHTPDPGDIILMHDGPGHKKTAQALPQILRELGAAGFKFVTVPELLRAWDQWEMKNEK